MTPFKLAQIYILIIFPQIQCLEQMLVDLVPLLPPCIITVVNSVRFHGEQAIELVLNDLEFAIRKSCLLQVMV